MTTPVGIGTQCFDIATLLLAGSLVGNEFAIATFVHPTFWRLPEMAHTRAASALARVLGRIMPFWYASVFLLSLGEGWLLWSSSARSRALLIASSVIWAGAIAFTLIALVPINNRVARWTDDGYPATWREDRARWDRLHRIRVALLAVGFLLLAAALLSSLQTT